MLTVIGSCRAYTAANYIMLSMQAMACPQASKAANINADSLKIMELYRDIFVNQNKVSSGKRFVSTPLGEYKSGWQHLIILSWGPALVQQSV